jgi:hypothetical protein
MAKDNQVWSVVDFVIISFMCTFLRRLVKGGICFVFFFKLMSDVCLRCNVFAHGLKPPHACSNVPARMCYWILSDMNNHYTNCLIVKLG